MRHMEDTLDVQLFDRTSTGYDLTSHGRELLSRVLEMDGAVEVDSNVAFAT